MRIMVIAGGNSSEREVSLRSGAAVSVALERAGHQVEMFDTAHGQLADSLDGYDVVFPIIHGAGGEDGSLQDILERADVPYVGSGPDASRLCFDKALWRQFVGSRGVLVADGAVLSAAEFGASPLTKNPFVLKPVDGGSTIDTIIVRDTAAIPTEKISQVYQRYDRLLIEQLIEGVEITVGIVGNTALPIVEIIPPSNGEFDYENKYNGATQELCPPQHIADELQKQAQTIAQTIHQMTGCRHLTRTDMIITTSGDIYSLETNTLPGMTNGSLLPKAAAAAGMDMSALCDRLIELACDSR